jgi:hypothetical protein
VTADDERSTIMLRLIPLDSCHSRCEQAFWVDATYVLLARTTSAPRYEGGGAGVAWFVVP